MSDIFISYDKDNRDLATSIARNLEGYGLSVWWDRHLSIGATFTKVIGQKLEDAKAVIVIWTPQSIDSQWVYAEADHAARCNKLVPLRIDEVAPSAIPKPFNLMQTGLVGDIEAVLEALSGLGLKPVRPGAPDRASQTPSGPPRSAEEKLYAEVEADGSIESYEYYLTRYPNGSNAALVEYRLHKLRLTRSATSGVPAQPGQSAAASLVRPAGHLVVLVGASNQEREFNFLSREPQLFRDDDLAPQMVIIRPGSFSIGSPQSETGHDSTEEPLTTVEIAHAFAVGRTPVTFDEWAAFTQDGGLAGYVPDDKGWGRGNRPVINVSWLDAHAYLDWLRKRTGKPYRLLSEAEWEYAARAGIQRPFSCGDTITSDLANFDASRGYAGGPSGSYRRQSLPVGSFPPNAFGLCDMHGNVREWVEDPWVDSYAGLPPDGVARTVDEAALTSRRRVVRGGSWYDTPNMVRSATRERSQPELRNFNTGFRVARTLD